MVDHKAVWVGGPCPAKPMSYYYEFVSMNRRSGKATGSHLSGPSSSNPTHAG